MPNWEEIAALAFAIRGNFMSLWGGILGFVFTVIWVYYRKEKIGRVFLFFAFLFLFLSPIGAFFDEYRDHKKDQELNQKAREAWVGTTTDLHSKLADQTQDIIDLRNENKQLKDMRQLQRLNLAPKVNASFYYNNEGSGFIFESLGPGPAVIKTYIVSVDGIPRHHWYEVLGAVGIGKVPISFSMLYPDTQPLTGNVSRKLIWIDKSPESDLLAKNSARILIEICYCALYGECWIYTNRISFKQPAERPEKLTSCKPAPFIFVTPPSP